MIIKLLHYSNVCPQKKTENLGDSEQRRDVSVSVWDAAVAADAAASCFDSDFWPKCSISWVCTNPTSFTKLTIPDHIATTSAIKLRQTQTTSFHSTHSLWRVAKHIWMKKGRFPYTVAPSDSGSWHYVHSITCPPITVFNWQSVFLNIFLMQYFFLSSDRHSERDRVRQATGLGCYGKGLTFTVCPPAGEPWIESLYTLDNVFVVVAIGPLTLAKSIHWPFTIAYPCQVTEPKKFPDLFKPKQAIRNHHLNIRLVKFPPAAACTLEKEETTCVAE